MARRRNAALPLVLNDSNNTETVYSELASAYGTGGPNNEVSTSGSLLVPTAQQDKGGVEASSVERYKLVVVGDEECGKTALLNALVRSPDYEVEDSLATFDACVTDVRTPQEHVEFTLYEISGLDNYGSLRIELYRGADVFLVCFDIGRPDTLDNVINKWVSEITEEFPKVPFLVIGCKNDLRTDSALITLSDDMRASEHTESVSRLKAEIVARNVGSAGYVECCAKTRWNVDRVFKAAAEAILAKDDLKEEQHTKHNSVLRRFSRLTSNEKSQSALKRGSIFSFVVGSNNT